MNKGEIVIYQTPDGASSIDVKFEDETVWLTQAQMVELFQRERTVVTKHINNIFKEKELDEKSNVHFLHIAFSDKPVKVYSLDVIISVGYRVKSQRGTQFRIWANKVLKNYLIKGYAVNEKATRQQLEHLNSMIGVLSDALENKTIDSDEATNLLRIIKDYSYGLYTLDKYDYQNLEIKDATKKKGFKITYSSAIKVIKQLKQKFGGSELFGREKDDSFKSSINTIYQTFDKKDLYPEYRRNSRHASISRREKPFF